MFVVGADVVVSFRSFGAPRARCMLKIIWGAAMLERSSWCVGVSRWLAYVSTLVCLFPNENKLRETRKFLFRKPNATFKKYFFFRYCSYYSCEVEVEGFFAR